MATARATCPFDCGELFEFKARLKSGTLAMTEADREDLAARIKAHVVAEHLEELMQDAPTDKPSASS